MKKSLIVLLLAAAATLAAQTQAAPSGQFGAASPSTAAPQPQKKVIQDQNEYAAYMAALNATDPAKKAQLLESFLQTYPNSVMKADGLDLLIITYQSIDQSKIKPTAERLIQADPNNLTALAVLSVTSAQAGKPAEAGQFGARGLKALETAPKPDGYDENQWNAQKKTFSFIFEGAVGNAALQAKDYPTAQQHLKAAVALQPNDPNSIYQLALSYLQPTPLVVDGLFWVARAAAISQNAQVLAYAKSKYARYHGGDQGFDELLADAKKNESIPAGFTVAPAPSPAEQAADMLKKGPPDKLSFAEWQFILTSGNKEASDAVWTAIKGKPVQLVANVIDAQRDSLKLAGSADDIDAKKADITLTLGKDNAIPEKQLPKPGAELVVQGAPSEYSAQGDAFNMTFTEGEVLRGLPAAPAPAKKPAAAAHKKAAQ